MSSNNHYEFNAHVSKIMNMIIHNFYSTKDIFLRELISNASDAIDKYRFNMVNTTEYKSPYIKIIPSVENNTLIIEDNGIGMTENDVITCLGTIAKSGTEEFIKKCIEQNNNSVNLIGQFGVGFYSAFLVSKNIQVITKNDESEHYILWESDSVNGFTVSHYENTDNNFINGTRIILYLNDDATEYLQESKLEEIIKKYSGYISYPISLYKKIKIEKPPVTDNKLDENKNDNNNDDDDDGEEIIMDEDVKDDNKVEDKEDDKENDDEEEDDKEDDKENDDEEEVDDKDDKEDDKEDDKDDDKEYDKEDDKVDDKEYDKEDDKEDDKVEDKVDDEYKYEFIEINSKPIWYKNPSDVSEDEYNNLYKLLSNDYESYQKVKHFKAEGDVEFSAILYIPKRAPFNLFEKKEKNKNIKLYVKKVLITDDCEDLYPEYLNFIVGIVDSQDLPLNASRELLQNSKIIKKINKILIRKTIEMINELQEEEFNTFYNNFNKNIKLAIHEDNTNKTKFLDLLMFPSSKSKDKLIKLQTYIDNMKENQAGFYYIIGNTLNNVINSAFIEKLITNDYEVLLMCDPLDEYIMQNIHEYNNIKFINVVKDDLKLDDKSTNQEEHKELCDKVKETLNSTGTTVSKVVISSKLESHPAIITNAMGWSANMERIIKAQALANNNQMSFMMEQKVLEINPNHSLIKNLIDNNYKKEDVLYIYNIGLLAGGYELSNVNEFLTLLYDKNN
jgi:molecular chaperone HtpG